MPISPDTDAGRAEAARAIFAALGDAGYANLPALTGADLCTLGGPAHPFFWQPLAAAWLNLRPRQRDHHIKTSTSRMISAGWLTGDTRGTGYRPGATYRPSPELGILLAARTRPAFIIASHFSPRLAPLALFAAGDETEPVRGIVMAVSVTPPGSRREDLADPLRHVFDHVLTTTGHAAEFLTDRALTPAPAGSGCQEQPPRLFSLFRPGTGPEPAAQLSVLGDGTTARVTGPGISGEFGRESLHAVMAGLIAQGTCPR